MDQPGAIDQCENDRSIRAADLDRWTAEISELHNFLRHRDLYGSSIAFKQVVYAAAPAREMRISGPNFLRRYPASLARAAGKLLTSTPILANAAEEVRR